MIGEISALGWAEPHGCESLLGQALLHLPTLRQRPDDMAAAHWRGEICGFPTAAQDRFSPPTCQRIGLEKLHGRATRQLRLGTSDPDSLRATPGTCPNALDDLLAARSDPASLVMKLDQAAST